MNTFKKVIGTVLLAGTLGVGTVAATAPAAHAETYDRCLAATKWSMYVYTDAMTATTWSEFRMWVGEYGRNEAWISANC
jgi:hypothetical protein